MEDKKSSPNFQVIEYHKAEMDKISEKRKALTQQIETLDKEYTDRLNAIISLAKNIDEKSEVNEEKVRLGHGCI